MRTALRQQMKNKESTVIPLLGLRQIERARPYIIPDEYLQDLKTKEHLKKNWYKSWRSPALVGLVNSKQESVGYLKEDRR